MSIALMLTPARRRETLTRRQKCRGLRARPDMRRSCTAVSVQAVLTQDLL